MADYIEREAVHELVRHLKKYRWTSPTSIESFETVNSEALQELIDFIPAADVVEKKDEVILLPLSYEELRHLINDAIFYIRMMENKNRAKEEFGYFSRQELLEKLKRVESFFVMMQMPCLPSEERSEE